MEKSHIIIAFVTQAIFLIGEIPAAGYLYRSGFTIASLTYPWFWIFTVTRFIGIAGQLYLWSETQLGLVAALMGACGLIASNILGQFLLHQPPLSLTQYIGLGLIVVSLLLLTAK
ncbi:hypothetical protein [Spirulina sp. 06S082]|uniref:hypothetical protein n=1 Tax=Spirulina sp. 06S082 TaxID=3110248 RepID=UPI002B20862A|nr:hypothetical protein [Spirulina sp. 06S082]MEA5469914.1 hypothetical protein [Spirulina sp. 06S082]